jgi:hypothetical protein
MSKLSAYGSLLIVLSILLRVRVAPEDDPVIVSPVENDPVGDATSRAFVVEFQDLTLAFVPLVDPVIISLNANSPIFVPEFGEAIEIFGATE